MAAITDVVRPGDPISSDLFMRMIALLNQHDLLISGVSPTPTTLLTGFDPPLEQNVGSILTAFGQFDFPLTTNNVSIDGIPIPPIQFLLGSGATQIRFKIPESIVVPPSSTKPVKVRVINSKGTGELNYQLKPKAAGPPDPTVSAAVDHGTGVVPLRSQQNARITGKNLASPAANNLVRLIFNPGAPTEKAFPPTPGSSLVIDTVASVINPAPADSTLIVMMPVLDATVIPLVGGTASASLELTATGAANPVTFGVTIRRTA
jgi:hypothetical protein